MKWLGYIKSKNSYDNGGTFSSYGPLYEGCAHMWYGGSSPYGSICFNDIPCSYDYGYVCEYSK